MRLLGFEAWDGGSHRAVRLRLERHAREAHWTWVTLEPGPWRWRQRLGMRQLVDMAVAQGLFETRWDCIVCTSLLAVGELRGLLPAALCDVPIVMLIHEHQAAYPPGPAGPDPRDDHAAVTDLLGMLAADRIVFTSDWNRRSCLSGLRALLRCAPRPGGAGWLDRIEAHSAVWWPPVDDPLGEARIEHKTDLHGRELHRGTGPLVVWPHRHQLEKGPGALQALARRYSEPLDLHWILLGERPGPVPAAMARFRHEQGDRLCYDGYCEDRARYLGWLHAADWVCSTAKHEFFGLATVEALLLGAMPWLPARLSYPELLPEEARGLHPGCELSESDHWALSQAIRAHLAAAIAPQSVNALEAILRVAADVGRLEPLSLS